MVNSHKFGAVREGGFHLDIGNHLGYPVHHVIACQDACAFGHQFGNGLAIACSFHDGGSDKRDRFRVIQFQAACLASFRKQGSREDKEFVLFAWSQLQSFSPVRLIRSQIR